MMFVQRTVWAVLGSAFLLSLPPATSADAQEARTWVDATGRFKIEARYVETRGDSVVLETSQGKKVSIALDRLSQNDQAHVASLQQENPFQAVEESPFQEMREQGSQRAASASGGPRNGEVNWNG